MTSNSNAGIPRTTQAASCGPQADLAARLRQGADGLLDCLNRRDTVVALIRSVNATLDPRMAADALLLHAQTWFPVRCLAVAVQDAPGRMTLMAERGPCGRYEEALVRVARWVTDQDDDFMSASLEADSRLFEGPVAAMAAFPLRCRAVPIGALMLLEPAVSAETPALPAAVLASLRVVLEGPALALDATLQLQRAQALSVTDDLTGLYNSRYLDQVLRRESKRAFRSGRPVSLLFLDLDGFKRVNDAHGHWCGSRTLIETGCVVRSCARETDMVARFGGDEFAIVLPETGSGGALAVAKRMRDRIGAHRFMAADGLNIRLTTSIGVATLPDVAGSIEELIKAADGAMYRVKDHGKDGIFLATEQFSRAALQSRAKESP